MKASYTIDETLYDSRNAIRYLHDKILFTIRLQTLRLITMVKAHKILVTFKPENLCKNKPDQRQQCVKAALVVFVREKLCKRRRVVEAVITNTSWSDKEQHIALYFADKKSKRITCYYHVHRGDITNVYEAEAFNSEWGRDRSRNIQGAVKFCDLVVAPRASRNISFSLHPLIIFNIR